MSKQNAGPVVRKAGEQGNIWITYISEGQKYFGRVNEKDFFKIGTEPVRVYMPMFLQSAEGKEATYGLNLDTNSYNDDFQYFNTRNWISWQRINPAHYDELELIVEKFKKQGVKK